MPWWGLDLMPNNHFLLQLSFAVPDARLANYPILISLSQRDRLAYSRSLR